MFNTFTISLANRSRLLHTVAEFARYDFHVLSWSVESGRRSVTLRLEGCYNGRGDEGDALRAFEEGTGLAGKVHVEPIPRPGPWTPEMFREETSRMVSALGV